MDRKFTRKSTLGKGKGRKAGVDWDGVVALYQTGRVSTREVGERFGVSAQTVTHEMRRRGLPRWPRGFGGSARYVLNIPGDEATRGYLAGMIDGDGSIEPHMPNCRVMIYNTDEGLMKWLREELGGLIYWTANPKPNDGFKRKPQAQWYCTGSLNIYFLLLAIRPYLIIKRHLADQTITYLLERYPALANVNP